MNKPELGDLVRVDVLGTLKGYRIDGLGNRVAEVEITIGYGKNALKTWSYSASFNVFDIEPLPTPEECMPRESRA